MFSSAHGNITVSVFFDKRRAVDGDKYPVKIRVRYNRDRKDYPTGKKFSEIEWVDLPKSKSHSSKAARDEIQVSFKIIDDVVLDLFNSDSFSFDALNVRLSNGSKSLRIRL